MLWVEVTHTPSHTEAGRSSETPALKEQHLSRGPEGGWGAVPCLVSTYCPAAEHDRERKKGEHRGATCLRSSHPLLHLPSERLHQVSDTNLIILLKRKRETP